MPAHIQWDNDAHTLVRITYEGEWEREDVMRIVDQLAAMLSSVDHPVDMIVDATKNRESPLRVISILGYMELKVSPNQRRIVVVGFNRLMKLVLDVAKRVAPRTVQNVHPADTLEEAYALIAAQGNGNSAGV